jgi:hypothetical protein
MLDPTLVQIRDTDIKRILLAVGGPVLSVEDLEITKDDILELVVLPALEVHFSYFPIEIVQEVSMAGSVTIPYPDPDLTIGLCSAQISMDIGNPNNPSISPFINDRNYQRGGLMRQGQYDMEAVDGNMMTRLAAQGAINLLSTRHLRLDPTLKVLNGFTSASGIARLVWANMSLNVDDVPIFNKNDFIRFCQANILEVLGTVRESLKLSDDVQMNGQAMQDKAKELRDEILDTWRTTTKVAISRG